MALTQQFEFKELCLVSWFNVKMTSNKALRLPGAEQRPAPRNLTELKRGESGVIERLDLPPEDATRLMEMGFVPGHAVTPAHAAPGGDPRVFRVDGSEVALRRETARKFILRPKTAEGPL